MSELLFFSFVRRWINATRGARLSEGSLKDLPKTLKTDPGETPKGKPRPGSVIF
jgi:hypothetical protein